MPVDRHSKETAIHTVQITVDAVQAITRKSAHYQQFYNSGSNLRASCQCSLYLFRYKTLRLQSNIKFQGVKIWNSVTREIKSYPSIDLKYNTRSISVKLYLMFPLVLFYLEIFV